MDIHATQLEKIYKNFHLGPLDFHWKQGDQIAIIGGNGAGKSTLFQALSGQTPYKGRITMGQDVVSVQNHNLKKHIGYLPQNLTLPPWSTPLEVISYIQHLHQSKVSSLELLKLWDCDSFANRPLHTCSHGMHKRVALALCTMHSPDLLILDEPFSGLDLYHLQTLHELILNRKASGLTTILSTHIAPYAARYTTQAWHMHQGELSPIQAWPSLSTDKKIELMESVFSNKKAALHETASL